MELWIRTQDRMNLVQIKQISLNYQNNKQVIANYEPEQYENSSCFYEFLGTYKTKERALEVLDEIQELLMPKIVFKDEGRDYITPQGQIYKLNIIQPINTDMQELSSYVYEMPKE